MSTRRTAIWLGSLFGGLLYLFILAAGPIWGGIERPQKRSIGSGAWRTLKPSSAIEKRTGKSTTARKSCANTGLMSIGLTIKCNSKVGRASAVSESSPGVTSKSLPMLTTAPNRARFAGFSAIDATQCSACAAMTQTFFQHWRGI